MRKIIYIVLILLSLAFPTTYRFNFAINSPQYVNASVRIPLWQKSPINIAFGSEFWWFDSYDAKNAFGFYGAFPVRFDIFKVSNIDAELNWGFGYRDKINYVRAQIIYGLGLKCSSIFNLYLGLSYTLMRYSYKFSTWQEDYVNWWFGFGIEPFKKKISKLEDNGKGAS